MDAITTLAGDRLLAGTGKAGWVTPTLDLVTAFANPPSKDTVIADATLATYTGYAAITPTLSNVYVRQPEAQAAFAMSQGVFLGPTGGAAQTAVGFVLHDGAGVVYASGEFDTPVNMASVADRLAVDLEVAVSPDTEASAQR